MGVRHEVAQLIVGIKADIKQLKLSLDQGLGKVKHFSDDLGKSSQSLQKLGKGFGIVNAAIQGVAIMASRTFADLEQSIANTASVTGDASNEMLQTEKFARRMGKETIYTATQAADAMYYLGSAGYNTGEIFSSLKGILSLAAATQYDLAETTSVVVSTLRAFGLEADQSSRVANVFAAAISSSQATMFKLQESMRYISPVAANLNYSIEQTVAALSKLYDSGLESSMSGTQLRMALTRLQKPTNAAYKAMKHLGVAYSDLNPAANDLIDIIAALEDANAGASENGRYMAEIFGVRAVNAMNILLRTGSSALGAMESNITNTTKALDMQQRQIDTLKGSWRLMISALQESSIVIGKSLEPLLKALMEAVRQLNLWFSALPAIVQKVIVVFGVLISAASLLGSGLLLLLGLMPKIITAITLMKVGFVTLAGPITAIVTIIGLLAAGLLYLVSAQEREKRQRKEMLIDYQAFIESRRNDLKETVRLAKEIKKLTSEVEDNETKQRQLERALKKLNDIQPGLIDDNKDLTEQFDKLTVASNEANKELKELAEIQIVLRNLKLSDELDDLRKRMKQLTSDLEKGGFKNFWKEQLGTFKGFGLQASDDVRKAFLDDIKDISDEFDNLVDRWGNQSKWLTKGISWGQNVIPLREMTDIIDEIGKGEYGINNLMKMKAVLASKAVMYEDEILKLKEQFVNASGEEKIILKSKIDDLASLSKVEGNLTKVVSDRLGKILELKQARLDEKRLTEEIHSLEEKGDKDKKDKKKIDEFAIEYKSKEEQIMYEIATAGVQDRIKLRKMELDQWHKITIDKLIQLGYKENEAREKLSEAFNKRKVENQQKDEVDLMNFSILTSTKSANDIYRIKKDQLDKWKLDALSAARSVGKGELEVEAAYNRSLIELEREKTYEILKVNTDLYNETEKIRIDAIENAIEKEIALENVNYKSKKDNLVQEREKYRKIIEKGLIDEETVNIRFNNQELAYEEAHQKKLAEIGIKYSKESNELKQLMTLDMMKNNILGIESLREREKQSEIANYMERKNALERLYQERLELAWKGQANLLQVSDWMNSQEEALYSDHMSKMNAIDTDYDSIDYERKLSMLDTESSLYNEMLENYKQYLTSKLESLKENTDEYKNILNKIDDIEDEQLKKKKKKQKELAKFTSASFSLVGDAIGKTGQGATDAWKESLKSFVKMTAEWLRFKAGGYMAASWANPAAVIGWGLAISAISALEHVAYGRIDAAATGAEVKKTGTALVHEGETIVPASAADLQRRTWSRYLENMNSGMELPSGSINESRVVDRRVIEVSMDFNVNAEGSVIAPANIDEQDSFYENVIKPAEERFKEAIGKAISEGQ